MKKCFTLLATMLIIAASWSQNADYLLKKDFQSEKKKISEGIDAAKKAGSDAKRTAIRQLEFVDSLSKQLSENAKAIAMTNDSLNKTSARFNELEARVNKTSMGTQKLLLIAVIVVAILFVFLTAFVFFLKNKTDRKLLELKEENKESGEYMKQAIIAINAEMNKTSDFLSSALHEHSAKVDSKIGQIAENQKAIAAGFEESIGKVAKEQAAQKSMLEEKVGEVLSKLSSEKTEHKSLHDKIESEVKTLRSLHIKDVEEIKAKI